jgi:hypothetical protein
MMTLLFSGPKAGLAAWFLWGLIIFIAGLAPLGGGSGGQWNPTERSEQMPDLPFQMPEFGPALMTCALALVGVAVLVGLVWIYFQARFRFVLLEGVLTGEPRIRGVFGRTSEAGLGYFVFLLVLQLIKVGAILLAVLPHLGMIRSLIRGNEPNPMQLLGALLTALIVVVPVVLAVALVEWFAYHLALPYAWMRHEPFGAALLSAWAVVRARFGAVLLLLGGHIITGFVLSLIAMVVFFCCACCLWVPPFAAIVLLAVATSKFPVVMIVTIPLILALAALIGWLASTLLAPVPIFFRSWSLAFVTQIDPSILPQIAPPAPPPVPPPPPAAPEDPPPGGEPPLETPPSY